MTDVQDYRSLIIDGTPLIDVRSPGEFSGGSLPNGVNLPVLDDRERHKVGLCYRQQGREAAFALGNRLVNGAKRDTRIKRWLDCLDETNGPVIYCARGGYRSKTVQQWIEERTGKFVKRLSGGYKAGRTFLLERLKPESIVAKPVVLGGRTGSGKTILLHQLENSLDLEAIANHRGSSFGRHISPQPSQADFENRLGEALVIHEHYKFSHLVVEDEGRHVGSRFLPKELSMFFAAAPRVLLETPVDDRIEITYEEYVTGGQKAFIETFGAEDGLYRWLVSMEESADRITKRLGRERLVELKNMMRAAHDRQLAGDHPDHHKEWIETLIKDYYDPMYDYQIKKSGSPVVFRGDRAAVLDFLRDMEVGGKRP